MNNPALRSPASWLMNKPYLLLSLTALFWASNAVLGRAIAGQFPPIALSFLRWAMAFVIVLPFAWPHLVRDRAAIREGLGIMVLLSVTGISAFSALQYCALEYTQALNAVLMQSSGPLFVAIWSLVLLGIRLTWAQTAGIAVSMSGVLMILLRGDLGALSQISLNKGDLLFLVALAVFGFYSALSVKRPAMHYLSFLAFTFGCGAVCLIPLFIWEMATRPMVQFTPANLGVLAYVTIFPTVLAYLYFNRGVELIGANRAAPFFYLNPVFGSALAIVFLGEQPRLFHLVGYTLVLAGVFIAARRSSVQVSTDTPAA